MAEFSKQWAEMHDPEFPWDFDALQIAEELENGHYVSIICEGLGFLAVGKDDQGNIILAMPTGEPNNEEGTPVEWKNYEEIIK